MKLLSFLLLTLSLAKLSRAGGGVTTLPRIVQIDVLQHAEADNLIDSFEEQVRLLVQATADDFSALLNSPLLEPQEALVEVETLGKQAEDQIDLLLVHVLLRLARIVDAELEEFVESMEVTNKLPRDSAQIFEFGRRAVVTAESSKKIVEGKTHEFVVKLLRKV